MSIPAPTSRSTSLPTTRVLTRSHFALALLLLLTASVTAVAADYTVSAPPMTPGAITVTDSAGNAETLTVSEPSPGNIKFAAAGRTFSVNGGGNVIGDSGNISLSGVNSVTVNAGAGADMIDVGAFSGLSFPSLTINGGTGDDTVNFNGAIGFDTDRNLDVDLQNDAANPGVDAVNVAAGANLSADGDGTITVRCSKNIALATGASLATDFGLIILEANQQEAAPTAGNFVGARVDAATVSAARGAVTVRGRGGDDPGGSQLGVEVVNGGQITGKNTVTVVGTGGASTDLVNRGVTVYGAGSAISSTQGSVEVTGTAGPVGGFFGIGVSVLFGGKIAGGNGVIVTGTGAGAGGSGFNQGLELSETGSSITCNDGHISIIGSAGPGGDSFGVYMANNATVTTPTNFGNISLISDSVSLDATAGITTTNPSSVVVLRGLTAGTAINLGGADAPGTLGLTDTELDRISTASLLIGNSSSGALTISAALSPALATNLLLGSGVEIRPTVAGTDVTLIASGILTLDGPVACNVTGGTADTGYPQLKVVGGVNLNGVALKLTGTFAGVAGNTFRVVDNDATDAITGTFAGLPQNAYLPWPGSTALSARISYTGGTNSNDAVLTLATVPAALNVTNTTDAGASSLRAVIGFAAGHTGADIVTFAAGLAGQTIRLASAINVDDAGGVTIDTPSGGMTINGDTNNNGSADGNDTQLFTIAAGSMVTMNRLTLTRGFAINNGGAIYNEGMLTLNQSTFTSNYVGDSGGAIYHNGGTLIATNCTFSGNAARFGGALELVSGSASITHCTFAGNESTGQGIGAGGAIENGNANLTLNYCLLAGNIAPTGNGPEMFMGGGTLTANGNLLSKGQDSTLTNGVNGNLVGSNSAPIDALLNPLANNGGPTQTMMPKPASPAVDAAPGSTATTDQRGFSRPVDGNLDGFAVADIGAVELTGPTQVIVTTAADEFNTPTGAARSLREAVRDAADGGLITFDPAVFTSPSHTVPLSSGLEIVLSKSVIIVSTVGVIIDGGAGTNRIFSVNGGQTVSLIGLNVTGGNSTGATSNGFGGAIVNGGALTLTRCTLSGNSAASHGGAIHNGGGTLKLTQSTFFGNSAEGGGAIGNNSGTLTSTHCTFSGNSAVYGGAFVFIGGSAIVTHCTLASNQSTGASSGNGGGAIDNYNSASLTLNYSLLGGNTAASGNGPDLWMESGIVTATENLLSNGADSTLTNGVNGNLVGSNAAPLDALLAPLDNYGGPTQTMATKPGSPARNAAVGSTITSDQRGFPIVGVRDIGAYEAGTLTNFNAFIWETLPASATVAQHAATFDYDGDGQTNENEFDAGTNPVSALSRLRITHTAFNGSGYFVIDFDAVANKTYTLNYKNAMTDPDWLWGGLPDITPTSTGTAQFIDYFITNETKLFYQVRVVPSM